MKDSDRQYGEYDARYGIADILKHQLRNTDVSPPKLDRVIGMSAILRTSEKAPPGFFEHIQHMQPDGYIIGPGIGSIITLINCFPNRVSPKGIVIMDIDPEVIIHAKLIVDELDRSLSWVDFRTNLLELPEEVYDQKEHRILNLEKPLQQRLKNRENLHWRPMDSWAVKDGDSLFMPNLDIFDVLETHYGQFHRLARDGNIAVIYTDMRNPKVVSAIRGLPNYSDLKNIVYLSNIADLMMSWPPKMKEAELSKFDSLQILENDKNPTIWIDAVIERDKTPIHLRIHSSVPKYH